MHYTGCRPRLSFRFLSCICGQFLELCSLEESPGCQQNRPVLHRSMYRTEPLGRSQTVVERAGPATLIIGLPDLRSFRLDTGAHDVQPKVNVHAECVYAAILFPIVRAVFSRLQPHILTSAHMFTFTPLGNMR